MAKAQPSPDVDSDISKLRTEKDAAWNSLSVIRSTWSDKERLLIGRLADSYSQKTTRYKVTDSHLATIAFERQARVASQLPTGKVYALSCEDDGAAALMNIVLQKYIIPHADSQFDLLTKFRMSGVYASVYGSQPILIDYRISDDYIGPDCYLIPPRNFLPQPGKNSVQDMDWCMVSTTVSQSYLEAIAKRKSKKWNTKNIQKLLSEIKDGAVPSKDNDSGKKSAVENTRTTGINPTDKGNARLELITKYESGDKGHWITFAPDYPKIGVLRDIPNPHQSGKIPIVMRQCFPLIDSIFGLGDFERGITLQKAKDSLINLYLDAIKLQVFPPLKVDLSGVTVSTIKYQAGAKWLVKDMNAVEQFESNPQGVQTFQSTYQFLSGALLDQNGSTNTSLSQQDSSNPAFGKTPEALQMQQQRESSRDNWDRFQLEKTIEATYEYMLNLLGTVQEKPINFHIFDDDIKTIKEQYGDDANFIKVINSKVAKLTLPKKTIGGDYKFLVDDSSSLGEDQSAQDQALNDILGMYMQNPQVVDQMLAKDNMEFKFGEAFKQKMINAGVNDWDDILIDHTDDQGENGMQPGQPVPGQPMPGQMPQGQPQAMNAPQLPQFQDPHIQAAAQQMFGQQAPQQMPQGVNLGQ